jgi:hypothetical protein
VQRTEVDHLGISFEVPGAWSQHAAENRVELLSNQNREQIIVAELPGEGADGLPSAMRLALVQRQVFQSLCKRGMELRGMQRKDVDPLVVIRFHASCEEPQLVVTLVAATAHGRVVSFEHYRYEKTALTPTMESTSEEILASLQIAGSPSQACPPELLPSEGGACLEPAILGEEKTKACTQVLLQERRWVADTFTAETIGKQTGKKLLCFRQP